MQKWAIFCKVKGIKEYRGGYKWYAAQDIPQIDPGEIGSTFHRAGAEIAENGHFWMETSVHP